MKMKTLVAALSGAFLIGAATLAPAQKAPSEPAKAVQPKSMENKSGGISGDQYKQEKDRIEADAKAAKEACKSMKDNAKDICEAEAKGKEKLAKKELDYKKNPNDKNAQDVEKMRAEVAYEVAKEKCEDMKGADMTKCKKDAKDQKDRAVAAAKGRKMADASGAATGSTSTSGPAKGASSTMSPTGREPSPNTNVQTQGTPTGTAGGNMPGSEKKSPGK